MTTKQIAKTALNAVLDRKAADIALLRVPKLTTLADYYIICTGSSNTQLRAISDAVDEALSKKYGLEPKSVEGYRSASWILQDYGSVIVHVFVPNTRTYYDLEHLWADGEPIDISEYLTPDNSL